DFNMTSSKHVVLPREAHKKCGRGSFTLRRANGYDTCPAVRTSWGERRFSERNPICLLLPTLGCTDTIKVVRADKNSAEEPRDSTEAWRDANRPRCLTTQGADFRLLQKRLRN